MLFVCPKFSPSATTPGIVLPTNPVSATLPVGGSTSLSYRDEMIATGNYLEIPDGAEIKVRPHNPYRAKMFIPCTYGRCPERMQLRVAYANGTPIERPYYLCAGTKWQCPNSQHPVYPEEINSEYVQSAYLQKKGRRSNERVFEDEMVTML